MTVWTFVSPIIFTMKIGFLVFSARCDAPVCRKVKKSAFLPLAAFFRRHVRARRYRRFFVIVFVGGNFGDLPVTIPLTTSNNTSG